MFARQSKNINRSSETYIQPQLEVGSPDDEYEKEANDVADKVMRMSEGEQMPKMSTGDESIQMMSDSEESIKMANPGEGKIQMMVDYSKTIQKMSDGNKGAMAAPQKVEQGINNSKGSGQQLPQNTQVDLGSKMNADFSGVKIHADNNSIQMNKEIGAKAFTHGNDIYFNQGQYNPQSSEGKHLLANELTHTVQQSNNIQPKIQKQDGKKAGKLSGAASKQKLASTISANSDIVLTKLQTAQLIATVMAESNQGDYDQREIAWIYSNLIASEGFESGMNKSSAYKYKSIWYKAYMIQLGFGESFKDDAGSNKWMKVIEDGKERAAKNIGEYVEKNGYFNSVSVPKLNEMKKFIENNVIKKQGDNPIKGWTGQGFYGDLNNDGNKGDHWNQVRHYYVLKQEGKITGDLIKIVGSGVNATFLFDRSGILKFFKENPKLLPEDRSTIKRLYGTKVV